MIMQMLFVKVGCYEYLKAVTPELLRQCNTYLMCKLGGCLSRRKALICMECYCSVFLPETFLHSIKLVFCKGR